MKPKTVVPRATIYGLEFARVFFRNIRDKLVVFYRNYVLRYNFTESTKSIDEKFCKNVRALYLCADKSITF